MTLYCVTFAVSVVVGWNARTMAGALVNGLCVGALVVVITKALEASP